MKPDDFEDVTAPMTHAAFTYDVWGDPLAIIDHPDSLSSFFIARDLNADFYACRDLSPAPDTILDLGANVGMFSIAMQRRYPAARIYAVEPVASNFANLRNSLELNRIESIRTIPLAVGPACEEVVLYGNPHNSGSYSFFNSQQWPSETVHSVSLGGMLDLLELDYVDFVKMDIEGSEYQTLMAFEDWDRIGYLSLELHPLQLAAVKAGPTGNDARNIPLAKNFYDWLCTKMSTRRLNVHTLHRWYRWGENLPALHDKVEL